MWVLDIIKY